MSNVECRTSNVECRMSNVGCRMSPVALTAVCRIASSDRLDLVIFCGAIDDNPIARLYSLPLNHFQCSACLTVSVTHFQQGLLGAALPLLEPVQGPHSIVTLDLRVATRGPAHDQPRAAVHFLPRRLRILSNAIPCKRLKHPHLKCVCSNEHRSSMDCLIDVLRQTRIIFHDSLLFLQGSSRNSGNHSTHTLHAVRWLPGGRSAPRRLACSTGPCARPSPARPPRT